MTKLANSKEGFHSDDNGSFEVFYIDSTLIRKEEGRDHECGWYWWPCSPGCLPDGEAEGSYGTSHEAYVAAFARVGEEPLSAPTRVDAGRSQDLPGSTCREQQEKTDATLPR